MPNKKVKDSQPVAEEVVEEIKEEQPVAEEVVEKKKPAKKSGTICCY